MVTMLNPGQKVQTESGTTCEVQNLLGVGGQGEVYRVNVSGKPMALKWYFASSATPAQHNGLAELVRRGAPNNKFLWPFELVGAAGRDEFGYIMPLLEPRYKGIIDLMKRQVDTTFRSLATAGYELADGYFRLHSGGMCYRDIAFGNVLFDPKSGEVLICDNDNVAFDGDMNSGVLGTPRFMAPEIISSGGCVLPSTKTDLYSLAVLLFYMFMFHHPLEGKQEADIHVMDMAAMTKIYGTHPIFIFDPNDRSNAPVPGYQDNALIFWPIYPQFLRDLFTRAFTDGIRDPENGRVRENEWRSAMIRLRDSIFTCANCTAENFYDVDIVSKNGGKAAPCWKCRRDVILPFRIRLGNTVVMLNQDTKLFPHHIDSQRKYDFTKPVAEIARNPNNLSIWGLRNLSNEKWVMTKQDGSMLEVEPGRSAVLAAGNKINFGNTNGDIRY